MCPACPMWLQNQAALAEADPLVPERAVLQLCTPPHSPQLAWLPDYTLNPKP